MRKLFKVETFDKSCKFIFFTEATNHKIALKRLITKSTDYKNICNNDKTLIIKVTQLK